MGAAEEFGKLLADEEVDAETIGDAVSTILSGLPNKAKAAADGVNAAALGDGIGVILAKMAETLAIGLSGAPFVAASRSLCAAQALLAHNAYAAYLNVGFDEDQSFALTIRDMQAIHRAIERSVGNK